MAAILLQAVAAFNGSQPVTEQSCAEHRFPVVLEDGICFRHIANIYFTLRWRDEVGVTARTTKGTSVKYFEYLEVKRRLNDP